MLMCPVSIISFGSSGQHLSESTVETRSSWYYARMLFYWFCGLSPSATSTPTQMTRLHEMNSLHQSYRVRAALYAALTILISLDLFLYVFFGTGSDFGLLRNRYPIADNTTSSYASLGHQTLLINHTFGT